MPRYGTISERKNRLHEVIRLSGTSIQVGTRSDSFTVKVASIPGIRLQVYFMDNNHYFKRKGVFADKEGKIFTDNEERALYFGHAALQTTKNLGWRPEVIHAAGQMSALVPYLVRTQYQNDVLFEQSRIVYTPDKSPISLKISPEKAKVLQIQQEAVIDAPFNTLGSHYADATAYHGEAPENALVESLVFEEDKTILLDKAMTLYTNLTSVLA